jgi:hypothetical protein
MKTGRLFLYGEIFDTYCKSVLEHAEFYNAVSGGAYAIRL